MSSEGARYERLDRAELYLRLADRAIGDAYLSMLDIGYVDGGDRMNRVQVEVRALRRRVMNEMAGMAQGAVGGYVE